MKSADISTDNIQKTLAEKEGTVAELAAEVAAKTEEIERLSNARKLSKERQQMREETLQVRSYGAFFHFIALAQ